MAIRIAASGEWGRVVWAADESGKSPARDFFLQLDDRDRAKVQAVFNRLADHDQVKSRERFKKLGECDGQALWEVKSFQLRFIGTFSPEKEFVVAHGLRKKRDKHRIRDLEVAARNLNDHFKE